MKNPQWKIVPAQGLGAGEYISALSLIQYDFIRSAGEACSGYCFIGVGPCLRSGFEPQPTRSAIPGIIFFLKVWERHHEKSTSACQKFLEDVEFIFCTPLHPPRSLTSCCFFGGVGGVIWGPEFLLIL